MRTATCQCIPSAGDSKLYTIPSRQLATAIAAQVIGNALHKKRFDPEGFIMRLLKDTPDRKTYVDVGLLDGKLVKDVSAPPSQFNPAATSTLLFQGREQCS